MGYKVFVADDHHILRHGVVSIVNGEAGYSIVGEASNGLEAYNGISDLNPDIAVLDVSMPEMTGLEVVKKCKENNLQTEFILLTMHKEEAFYDEALEVGAKGYILKENSSTDLIDAIKIVANGESYTSPVLLESLMESRRLKDELIKNSSGLSQLTSSELGIMKQLSENRTSREISEYLHISIRTVQNHRANICLKLGIRGTNKLLQYAIENKDLF